jgi:glycosyltransferase involved in cell wall biosynthesis
MRIGTVVSAASLSRARVLADDVGRHYPGTRLQALCLTPTEPDEPFDVVRLNALGLPEPMSPPLDAWPPFGALLRPALLRWLLERGAERAIYLDPTVDLIAPLETLERALEEHPLVVLPRVDDELPDDDLRPRTIELRKAGRISHACLAATAAPDARACLDWLVNGLRFAARTGTDEGLSQWLDLLPSRFPETVHVIDDHGMLVSIWNLHGRGLRMAAGHRPFADGARIRTVHFDRFDSAHPYWLSELGNRVRVVEEPVLVELCASYARRLRAAAGKRDFSRLDDVGRELPNGMVFDGRVKHLYDEALLDRQDFGDVFSPEGVDRFVAWMKGPAIAGADAGVNRYIYRVYRERADIADAYPDLDSRGEEFAGWCWVWGRTEMDIPDEFLPPRPGMLDGWTPETRPEQDGGDQDRTPVDLSVNVAGYFTGAFGIGAAARLYLASMHSAGISVATTTVEVVHPEDIPGAPVEDYGKVRFTDLEGDVDPRFNLVLVNPEELPLFADTLGERFFAQRTSIGVWAWETDFIPASWADRFELFDELWVYSRFVAENLSRASPIPVVPIPIPIVPPDPDGEELELELPAGYRFLFMFDFNSTAQRKNPLGLIEAFKAAFAPGEGPELIVKTLHAHHHPDRWDALRWAAEGRPDIHLIDSSLSRRQRDALIVACDCFVSLHRSEGFGLGLAEAMAVGKPTVATAYGGSLDFMTPANSYLVGWAPTRVGPEGELYPPDGTWAEPDARHAAELLRHVVEHPDEAAAKGRRGREDVARDLSVEAVGERMRERLERLALRASRRSAALRG